MAMLRLHLMQNWFGYSDPAMEEALYETTILNVRRLLDKHELAAGALGVINSYLGRSGRSGSKPPCNAPTQAARA